MHRIMTKIEDKKEIKSNPELQSKTKKLANILIMHCEKNKNDSAFSLHSDQNESQDSLDEKLKQCPGNIESRLKRAELLKSNGEYAKALVDYEYVNKLYP